MMNFFQQRQITDHADNAFGGGVFGGADVAQQSFPIEEYDNTDLRQVYGGYTAEECNNFTLAICPQEFFLGMVNFFENVDSRFSVMTQQFQWLEHVGQAKYEEVMRQAQQNQQCVEGVLRDLYRGAREIYIRQNNFNAHTVTEISNVKAHAAAIESATRYEVGRLEHAVAELNEANAARAQESTANNQKSDSILASQLNLKADLDHLSKQVTTFSNSMLEDKATVARSQSALSNAQSSIEALRLKVSSPVVERMVRGTVSELAKDWDRSFNESRSMLMDEVQRQIKDVSRKIDDSERAVTAVEAANERREETIASFRRSISSVEHRMTSLEDRVRNLEAKVNKAEAFRNHVEMLQQEMPRSRDLDDRFKKLEQENRLLRNRVDHSEREINNFSRERRTPEPIAPRANGFDSVVNLSSISAATSFNNAPPKTRNEALENDQLAATRLKSEGYMRTKSLYASAKFPDPAVLDVLQSSTVKEYGFPANGGNVSAVMSEFVQLLKDFSKLVRVPRQELVAEIEKRLRELHDIHNSKKDKCYVTPGSFDTVLELFPGWQLAEILVCLRMETTIKLRDATLDVKKTRAFFHRIFKRARMNPERNVPEQRFIEEALGTTHTTDQKGAKINIETPLDF